MALPSDLVGLAEPMAPRPFLVQSVLDELPDTFTLTLDPPDGSFTFRPGQFTMLYAFGIGEVPISISGDPLRPEVLVQTIRRVGAVTGALQRLGPSDVVGVRGPFGKPWPIEDAEGRDVVFVAGGIGLAPLRPAIYHALANRDRYGRVVIVYGARNRRELLYPAQLHEWRSRFDVDVMITVDDAAGDWHGSVGVVTRLIPRAPFDPDNAATFVCGPEVMMRFTATELTGRGVAPDSIFLSLERNMKCAIGFCGHCQFGAHFVCWNGPVFRYEEIERLLVTKEV